MGRSGTSAISGALQVAGVDLGRTLIGANAFNTKGHFENSAVVKLNSAILKSLGSYNGDFSPLDEVDWAAARAFASQAREIVRSEFSAPLFAIKDPRMCRVWPIWAQAFTAIGAAVRFLIPMRHPMEVTQSLYGYGCSTNQALMWWLAHTLDAERHTRGARRTVVSYHELLGGPKHTLERIGDQLGVIWPRPLDQTEPGLRTFLDRSMRHRAQDSPAVRADADHHILALAEIVYEEMMSAVDADRMDSRRGEFAGLVKACRGWRPQVV